MAFLKSSYIHIPLKIICINHTREAQATENHSQQRILNAKRYFPTVNHEPSPRHYPVTRQVLCPSRHLFRVHKPQELKRLGRHWGTFLIQSRVHVHIRWVRTKLLPCREISAEQRRNEARFLSQGVGPIPLGLLHSCGALDSREVEAQKEDILCARVLHFEVGPSDYGDAYVREAPPVDLLEVFAFGGVVFFATWRVLEAEALRGGGEVLQVDCQAVASFSFQVEAQAGHGALLLSVRANRDVTEYWCPLPWKLKFQKLMKFFYRWLICRWQRTFRIQ
ncbi:histidine triad nucleotide-binding 4 [Striga asiatica]|uniref:Histidine triad nucleotide-binding 4 n=1 Tax=Striga asiatica TaxID=4170 RepID=A0A5A7QX53_STRAF|nr:histidine triad nucleotide-binding 4 [Striga asiatica]